MTSIRQLFENNRAWADERTSSDPDFFARLARRQSPRFLWIGCADSRVPAVSLLGLPPGELFVHRNIANRVMAHDTSFMAVLDYAVDVLRVRHIIVCGHYGCGGIRAAMGAGARGPLGQWLRPIRTLYRQRKDELEALADPAARIDRFCELHTMEQVVALGHIPLVQNAWGHGQRLTVHGWMYVLSTGRLKDLNINLSSPADLRRRGNPH